MTRDLLRMGLNLFNWLPPRKIQVIQQHSIRTSPRILDIGCGNSSPSLTKHWFPECEYHGVDVAEYNLTECDTKLMDRFFLVGRDNEGYDSIPDEYYDFVVLNHVIEHNSNPIALIRIAAAKVSPGGIIYVAFPSQRSIDLPSAVGTLNFFDDPGHVWLPDVALIVNTLFACGVRVFGAGRSVDRLRKLIGAVVLPWAVLRYILSGKFHARGLWYLFNFEDFVIGRKPALGEPLPGKGGL